MGQETKQMRLADFIAQTVTEIVDGVTRAQEHGADKGASINPQNVNYSHEKQCYYIVSDGAEQARPVTPIDFDILLTLGDDATAQGGVGVFAAALGLGFKGERKGYSESASRLKFQILVALPQQTADH